jgi:hypothetical protein
VDVAQDHLLIRRLLRDQDPVRFNDFLLEQDQEKILKLRLVNMCTLTDIGIIAWYIQASETYCLIHLIKATNQKLP